MKCYIIFFYLTTNHWTIHVLSNKMYRVKPDIMYQYLPGRLKTVRRLFMSANNTPDDFMDIEMIDVTFEDGTVCSCEIIARFNVNGAAYAALLPEDDEESDILVYRYAEQEGDEVELKEITDENEFNEVADALDEILDDLEFNSKD